MLKARIIAQGSYLPDRILTNSDLEALVETSDEWILSRTGIKERRIAADDEFSSDMGAKAGKKALERANLSPDAIDLILVATMTPDYLSPSTAVLIQKLLGCHRSAAMDLAAACSGYLYGLATAKAYVESGMAKNVLLIASEKVSAFVDWQDRATCVLFGDGAGACIVSATSPGWLIGPIILGSDGEQSELFEIPAGGSRQPATIESVQKRNHFIRMQGREIFRHAVRRMTQAAGECLKLSGYSHNDLDQIVCHQANLRILDAVAERLEVSTDKVYKTLSKYGNTSAASLAITFDELCQDPLVNPLNRVLMMAFGAGLTWGSALLERTES